MKSELPDDWRSTTIGDVATIQPGQSPPGSSLNEDGDGHPFYQGARDFGRLSPTRRVYTTEPRRWAQRGDVLLSVRAPVGRVNRASEDCVIGRGVMALRGTADVADTRFLEYFLTFMEPRWGAHESAGSVFTNLSKRALQDVPVELPPLREQQAIAEMLGALDEAAQLADATRTTIDALVRSFFGGLDKAAWEDVLLGEVADSIKGLSYRSDDLRPSHVGSAAR